jgi:hypothetical protein
MDSKQSTIETRPVRKSHETLIKDEEPPQKQDLKKPDPVKTDVKPDGKS